jgi:hypothetical protein
MNGNVISIRSAARSQPSISAIANVSEANVKGAHAPGDRSNRLRPEGRES